MFDPYFGRPVPICPSCEIVCVSNWCEQCFHIVDEELERLKLQEVKIDNFLWAIYMKEEHHAGEGRKTWR